jgi:hypothetical protein
MFKTLRDAEVTTPTGIDDAIAQLEGENRQRRPVSAGLPVRWAPQGLGDEGLGTEFEPLAEPASDDEIPWSELAYWLDTTPDCACASCRPESIFARDTTYSSTVGHYVFIPGSFYSHLSVKIPVIRLPRIEGLN